MTAPYMPQPDPYGEMLEGIERRAYRRGFFCGQFIGVCLGAAAMWVGLMLRGWF